MTRGMVLGVAIIGGAFALGRYTAPVKTVTVEGKETVRVERIDTHESKIIHKRKVLHIATDGSKTLTTDDITANDSDKTLILASSDKSYKAQMTESRSRILLQGILGIDHGFGLSYGLGLSYRILGPISLGAAYLQNKPALVLVGVEL